MSHYTFTFEELQPIPGVSLLAYGEADIQYSNHPAEPDVGIMSSYIEFDVMAIRLDASSKDGNPLSLDPKSELFCQIEDVLQREYAEIIQSEIEEL